VSRPGENIGAGPAASLRDGIALWLELVRPRVASFVVFAAFVGALLAVGPDGDLSRALAAALLVGATAASASTFNQLLERDTDALMQRTRNRPLVTGAISVRDAVLFAASLGAVGVVGLAVHFGALAALLALATLTSYVLVYTPLKRQTTLNTAVGALPGAMPPLLGYVAAAGELGPWAWALFAVLFAWQFPHFLAIAWLYREDYARAGHQMLPALPARAGMAGRQAFLYALALLPVSLWPVARGIAGPWYALGALLLGLAYAGASLAFARREGEGTARRVLLVSLFYLPLLLSLVLLDPAVRLAAGTT
jgi:protoheme IX farnesyltransferase